MWELSGGGPKGCTTSHGQLPFGIFYIVTERKSDMFVSMNR